MRRHYASPYILNPENPVTVAVVGCGGTGSNVLTGLARINHALSSLGHPGLHVTAYDPDVVSEANVGRQLFSPVDVGQYKAQILVTRINRFYGLEWEARCAAFGENSPPANIIITCVDTGRARVEIAHALSLEREVSEVQAPYYWLDFGNSAKTGQVVLGTLQAIEQPGSTGEIQTISTLPTIIDLEPNLSELDEETDQPSCSLAEALTKQDLFINSVIAMHGLDLLWKLFREGYLAHHGMFVNLGVGTVAPIRI